MTDRPCKLNGSQPRTPAGASSPRRVSAPVAPLPLCRDQSSRIRTVGARVLLALSLLGLIPGASAAQGFGPAAASRSGSWIGLGAGHGLTALRCGICESDRGQSGLGGYVRAGGTFSERLLLGGEATHWRRSEGDVQERTSGLTATGYWYPDPQHGYYLRFGAGLTWYRAAEDDIALTAQLLSLVSGVGYEMRVNHRVSLVPFANVMVTAQGDMLRVDTRNGGYTATRVTDDLGLLSLHIGIGITRH
jgi:hypothetical protein